jgi:F0F1-type ATP synthase membrane subunit c/vacuolar-type H+-ATPase subunit K
MEEVLSKKLAMLVAAAMMALCMLAASVPAFAQGGCQSFGIKGVVDQARYQPGSMGGYASFFGPQDAMDDVIHQSQEDFCG